MLRPTPWPFLSCKSSAFFMLFGPHRLHWPMSVPLIFPILSGLVVHASSRCDGSREDVSSRVGVLPRTRIMHFIDVWKGG